MSRYLRLPLLVFIVPLVLHAKDREPIVLSSQGRQSVGLRVDFFVDETGSLSIDDILSRFTSHFLNSTSETLNFGPTSSACWVHFTYSFSDSSKQFLEIGNSNLRDIDFYVVDEGKVIQAKSTGLNGRHSYETFMLSAWLLELPRVPSGKAYSVYVRVTDPRRVIIPLQVTDINSAIRAYHKTDFLFGLYFGCVSIIAIMNIFFFLYFKDRMYLFYSFHIITQILINGILKGYLLSLFGESLYFLSPYVSGLAGLSNVSIILFSLEFLNVRKQYPAWHKAGLWLMTLPALNVALNLVGQFKISALTGTYIGFIVITYLFVLGLFAYRHNIKQARFYIVGWSFFFAGIIILNSALIGWIPVTDFTYNAAVFGVLFEVLLISAALADRLNLLRLGSERERQEKITLIEQQKNWLEENVKLRTAELTSKNNEIESQNEELKQQHEELSTTHELLEKQRQVVENINQSLEQKVQERTVELEETVRRLIKQNHDLQQFSYIVSHNMRAPVVRILGLLDLIKMEKSSESEKELMYTYLKDSALGLDQIIHDLSQIVAVRKGLDTMVEQIDVAKVLRHNQTDLTDEIEKAGAAITTAVKIDRFVSVKSYIQSILYNLLSNAIKYRSPNRKLHIDISAIEENGNVVFKVKDNGLGIDLPETRMNEVFNLYKRLHTHMPGKGLGLYLVKTQVEALNGKIEVKSAVADGTTFTVTIPKN